MPIVRTGNKVAKTKKGAKKRLAPTGTCPKCRRGQLVPFRRGTDHFSRCTVCRTEFRRQTL